MAFEWWWYKWFLIFNEYSGVRNISFAHTYNVPLPCGQEIVVANNANRGKSFISKLVPKMSLSETKYHSIVSLFSNIINGKILLKTCLKLLKVFPIEQDMCIIIEIVSFIERFKFKCLTTGPSTLTTKYAINFIMHCIYMETQKKRNFWKTQQKFKKSKKKNLLTEIEPLQLAF